MKISILTATYNRASCLDKLYNSIIENSNCSILLEWLIMDDGSTDNTKQKVEQYIKEGKIDIKYYYQQNKGKMSALNNIVKYANGELIIECDSDDYFIENAFEILKKESEILLDDKTLYAIVFPRKLINSDIKPINIKIKKTTMFDLYYKYGLQGETNILFNSEIRKKYCYKLENNERFITEARMYHEMDLKYEIKFCTKAISVGEYYADGYSKNIQITFLNSPIGYYMYFKEMFEQNMKGIIFKKRLYIIKHYILFSYLTKQKNVLKNVNGLLNRVLTAMLIIPGYIKSWVKIKEWKENKRDIKNQ